MVSYIFYKSTYKIYEFQIEGNDKQIWKIAFVPITQIFKKYYTLIEKMLSCDVMIFGGSYF